MRQPRFYLVLMRIFAILAASLLIAAACRKGKETQEEMKGEKGRASNAVVTKSYKIDRTDRNNKFGSSGQVRILSATPQGRTASPHESETVVVIFDRPMVPLAEYDETIPSLRPSKSRASSVSPSPAAAESSAPASPLEDQRLLKIDPPPDGRLRWVGTRTLAFIPARRFPYATEIKVTVPAGLTALDGSHLLKDFTWTFQTIEPRLLRHFPSDGQRWVRLDPQVLLIFNQPMAKEKALPFISWVATMPDSSGASSLSSRALPIDITHPLAEKLKEEGFDLSPDHALLLTLSGSQKLSPETSSRILLKKGLPAREGHLGLEKDYSFTFETFGGFEFEGLLVPPQSLGYPKGKEQPVLVPPFEQTSPPVRLPVLTPDETLQFKFTNPVYYKEFVSRVEFDPPVEIPDYYSEWEYSSQVLNLVLPLEPEKNYLARISADLTDEFGNKLSEPVAVRFQTGSFPPSVSMTTGHGVIEAYARPVPSYPLHAINQDKVIVQAARLSRESVIPLLTQEKIFWSNEKFTAPPGFFQLEKTLPLNLPSNQRRTVPIHLAELFPGSSRYGIVFLQVDTCLPDQEWDRYLKVFLQVTELGISAKFSPENNVIWVTELKTGQPVAAASLELRDDSNTVRWRGQTDSSGRAEAPGWKKLGLARGPDDNSEPRQWVFASRGADTAFTSSEWGTGLDPYRFKIAYDWLPEPQAFQGAIFTERGIYRAGETVHIKGIIREKVKGQWQIPSHLKKPGGAPSNSSPSLNCEITDPFNKVVFRGPVFLDDFGSFDLDFSSAQDFSLGNYQITVTLPSWRPGQKEPEATFSGSFRIEAFRPAEFEVHLRAAAESFVFGRDYTAEIRANYLFGGAMSDQEVAWYLRLNRTSFEPPGHPGYIFGNELDWGEEEVEPAASRLLASGQTKLDAKGRLLVKLPLVAEKEKDSVMATLEATVTDPSRRAISSRIQSLVHRGEFYIGVKPSSSFLKKGDSLGVEVIATSPEGKLLPGRKVGLKLVRREWRSVRQVSVGGRFRWHSEREDIEVEARSLQTGSEPVTLVFKPEKSGFYFLLASASDEHRNSISTTTSFYVTGRDYVPWERSDDDAIELVSDSPSYRPGDRARILVKSPYERAKGLVTVEREFILDARVVDIEGTASSVEIPIRPEYIPNVFVSVLLVHGREEVSTTSPLAQSSVAIPGPAVSSAGLEDMANPSFKIGYVNLPIDPSEKRLFIKIDNTQPEYKPREKVTLKFKVEGAPPSTPSHPSASPELPTPLPRQASLSVAVVDIGVLNLIGYATPDPFSSFYGERPLSVRTSETRIHVVGQREYGEKGEEPGGGGMRMAIASPFGLGEVELRGDFRSTAYWNPSLLTDEKGEATVSFILPDNLTTFRVMAVAQTQDSRFGAAETTLRVTKKLLLQPSIPRFLRVGDSFEGGVVVHNFSSAKGNVKIELEASGIRLLDKNKERRVDLKPGESREVLFAFKAEEPGQATFSFRGQMGEETDGLELRLPIHLTRPTETVALSGEVDEMAVLSEERIAIPEDVYLKESQLEVEASSSALIGLKGSLSFLTEYPYACLEQRLSAILPYIVARRVLVDFGLTPLSEKDIDTLVRRGLKEILSFQKENGGFRAWPDSPFESPFLTCYAGFALIKAREQGYEVEKESLDAIANYLIRFLREGWKEGRYPFGQRSWKTTRAYALYILSLLGKPQPVFADRLYAERASLSLFAQTLLLKALHHGRGSPTARAALLHEILNKIKLTPTEAHFEDEEGREGRWIYSSNGRTTAFILQTLIELGEDHPLLAPMARWLVGRQRGQADGRLATTQETFYLFYALNSFYTTREKRPVDLTGKISLAGRTLLEERFGPEAKEIKKASFGLIAIKAGLKETLREERELPLRIERKGQGSLYYGARLTYAPKRSAEPRDEGMAVVKRIEPLNFKTTGQGIKAGSLVVVTIEIAVPQESLYVVVEDPLPAGFEAVNPTFLTESEEAERRLEEIRAGAESPARRWWRGFNHVEMHDDRVVLFADSLGPGLHTHRYLARALSFGTFVLPGTRANEMYSPEVFGRSPEALVKVVW
ncbi:MAG: alpha-2-macroglobulin family protein [Candidatus Aminicenantales bacterium]